MSIVDFHHGHRTVEEAEGANYIQTTESSTVGIVVVADDADPTAYPLNKPVALTAYDAEMHGKAGNSGTLGHVLDAIYDQGYSPRISIVRVADSADPAELVSNIIGGVNAEGRMTGMQALLTTRNHHGFTPRIIGAPGLDHELNVAQELVALTDKLRGFTYLPVPVATATEAVTYRQNFGSKRCMLIWPEFTGLNDSTLPATARAIGMRVKADNEIGWHKTISNLPVNGVSGISRDVDWDLQRTDTTADFLNKNQVTTLINEQGFRFWGNRTCSDDPKFAFENYTRTGDILGYSFAQAEFDKIDRPMSRGMILDIIDAVNQKFKELTRNGFILGGRCWIEREDNLNAALMNGRLVLKRKYTPVPPLEDLLQKQIITDEYVVNLLV